MSEQRQQRGWGNDAGRRGSREGRREGLELAAHQVRVRILLRGTTRSESKYSEYFYMSVFR